MRREQRSEKLKNTEPPLTSFNFIGRFFFNSASCGSLARCTMRFAQIAELANHSSLLDKSWISTRPSATAIELVSLHVLKKRLVYTLSKDGRWAISL